ncbi:endoplasmic reticulum lectin 1 isoform X2 [Prorops nasuta]|uniref:endoplasmic reticulum lectin 1 isoform X2 n=1 Tax=Prorops nasuta TaxID=863751 RepID=UPI0034CD2718
MWRSLVILHILARVVHGHDIRSFDDTVLFKINWPGKNSNELLEQSPKIEPYLITTANNEKYQCFIPDITEQEQYHSEPYTGPNPIEILAPLFSKNHCAYKLESYWTYELCHGRYVRQYHEDREGKKVKVQEYYLGNFDKSTMVKLAAEYAEQEKNSNKKQEVPVKKIDGINMPYVEIEMAGGTLCDLNNKPRMTKILYVCYLYGKHEIYSLKEISSCEYEAIVFSPLLCSHPDYKLPDTGENTINCRPLGNTPKKPRALVAMEKESLKLQHQKVTEGESRVTVEIHPVDIMDKHHNIEDPLNTLTDKSVSPAEVSPVQNLLSGKNCLHGGNGWWKYEFCYGRSVNQYHLERDGTKTIVNLGNFDKKKHLDWITAHPHKKPKPPEVRKYLTHFYSDGSECDKTGKLRQTEVKLKCVENHATSPSSVSLFLLEPKTCEYILGVESPLICDILEYADENGLISEKLEVNFDKSKGTGFHLEQDELDERIANEDE